MVLDWPFPSRAPDSVLSGLLSPQAQSEESGWKGESIYCGSAALSTLGGQIQQVTASSD